MWARIENDTVMEIIDFDPEGRFHKDLEWVMCSDTAEEGMILDRENQTMAHPPKEEEEQIASVKPNLLKRVIGGGTQTA